MQMQSDSRSLLFTLLPVVLTLSCLGICCCYVWIKEEFCGQKQRKTRLQGLVSADVVFPVHQTVSSSRERVRLRYAIYSLSVKSQPPTTTSSAAAVVQLSQSTSSKFLTSFNINRNNDITKTRFSDFDSILNSSNDTEIKSFKTNLVPQDIYQYENIESMKLEKPSAMHSETLSRFNKLLGSLELTKPCCNLSKLKQKRQALRRGRNQFIPAASPFKQRLKEIVQLICINLQQQILTKAEIDKLDRKIQSSNASTTPEALVNQPLNFSSFSATPGTVQIRNLDRYLMKLVIALNTWFPAGEENPFVGIRSLLISLIYLERVYAKLPSFTLTVFNVQQLFAVMMLVAAKFTEDEVISNRYWAHMSAINFKTLNTLEEHFCQVLDYDFFLRENDLLALYNQYGLKWPRVNRLSSTSWTTL